MIVTKIITTILPRTEQGREYADRMQKYQEFINRTDTDCTIELTEMIRFESEEVERPKSDKTKQELFDSFLK